MIVGSLSLLVLMLSVNFWIVMIWIWSVELTRYELFCHCFLNPLLLDFLPLWCCLSVWYIWNLFFIVLLLGKKDLPNKGTIRLCPSIDSYWAECLKSVKQNTNTRFPHWSLPFVSSVYCYCCIWTLEVKCPGLKLQSDLNLRFTLKFHSSSISVVVSSLVVVALAIPAFLHGSIKCILNVSAIKSVRKSIHHCLHFSSAI